MAERISLGYIGLKSSLMDYKLSAGPVQVRYENGFLRYLTLNGTEVVRMIYFAVRDQDWRTAQLTMTNEVVDQQTNAFQISYDWQANDLGIQMAGNVLIVGASDGSISFEFRGEALSKFRKNRVGVCVLHPLEGITGQPCQIETVDGARVKGYFPDYISPYQPFLDIQALRWQPVSGHDLQLDFSGDVFEMEDQRNWTDASFKTYSTPLALPFPAIMQPGETVQQRVGFRVHATEIRPDTMLPDGSPAFVTKQAHESASVNKAPVRPRIGLGQRSDGQVLSATEAMRLRELPLSHLRADVLLTTPNWPSRLTNALADARQLSVPLELALFFGNEPAGEVTALLRFMGNDSEAVSSVLVFDATTLLTSDTLLQAIVPSVRLAWPNALIGGGTDGFFADFNRNSFDYSQVDFITYAVTPQVHAFDDLSLLENIDGQPPTVRTARHLTGGKPVHISPITLLPRYNTIAQSASERLSPPIDPRQTSDFGADWTHRSLTALTSAGVNSVTYFETHGPRGLVDGELIFPLFEVFRKIATLPAKIARLI